MSRIKATGPGGFHGAPHPTGAPPLLPAPIKYICNINLKTKCHKHYVYQSFFFTRRTFAIYPTIPFLSFWAVGVVVVAAAVPIVIFKSKNDIRLGHKKRRIDRPKMMPDDNNYDDDDDRRNKGKQTTRQIVKYKVCVVQYILNGGFLANPVPCKRKSVCIA